MNKKWRILLVIVLQMVALVGSAPAMSGGTGQGGALNSELDGLKLRLERLESIVASQQKIIEEQREIIERQRTTLVSPPDGASHMEGTSEKEHLSWSDRVHIGGLIEVGAGWENTRSEGGTYDAKSDITLVTVEMHVEAEIAQWIDAESVILYEDHLFGDDDHENFDIDEAVLTLGNPEISPFYASIGKMYVPFGALLTNFPDDPLTDVPLTLLLGETNEKSILLGFDRWGLSLSGYIFNGELEKGEEDHIEDYGFDIHYKGRFVPGGHVRYGRGEKYVHEAEQGFDYLIGFSYISNIADSDRLTEVLEDNLGDDEIHRAVPGMDAYFHVEYRGIFLDAEYMGTTRSFKEGELSRWAPGARPKVWNLEAGFNYDWWRNLEVVFKYAGSSEMPDFPKSRLGICLNQELFEGVIASFGYLHDEYDNHDSGDDPYYVPDKKDFLFWQIAAEF